MKNKVTKIYYLTSNREKDNNLPIYVGKTVGPLKARLSQHIHEAKTRNLSNKKDNWIRRLLEEGIKPSIHLIKEVSGDWEYWEKYYISKFRDMFDLKNHSDGGEGCTGKTVTKKTRNKISEALTGRSLSETHIENIRKARTDWVFSEETKQKISESHKGKVLSKKTREKISNSKLGTPSKKRKPINQYDLDGNFIKKWESIQRASEELNICRPNIIKVLKGYRDSAGEYNFKYCSSIKTV